MRPAAIQPRLAWIAADQRREVRRVARFGRRVGAGRESIHRRGYRAALGVAQDDDQRARPNSIRADLGAARQVRGNPDHEQPANRFVEDDLWRNRLSEQPRTIAYGFALASVASMPAASCTAPTASRKSRVAGPKQIDRAGPRLGPRLLRPDHAPALLCLAQIVASAGLGAATNPRRRPALGEVRDGLRRVRPADIADEHPSRRRARPTLVRLALYARGDCLSNAESDSPSSGGVERPIRGPAERESCGFAPHPARPDCPGRL